MVLSEVGALRREFCILEIGTWGNDGRMRVWLLIKGDIKRFYCISINVAFRPT